MYFYYIDTVPTTCWKKSQCGLELQYGNLILLRLVEVKDYYLADPGVTVTIIDDGKFHKKPNSEFHGIVLEAMDVYPIIKYSEYKFGRTKSEEQTDSVKFSKGKSSLVRTKPVKRKIKTKVTNKPVDNEQKSVFSSDNTVITNHQTKYANGELDQAKDQNFNVTSDNSLLEVLDLAVLSKPVSHRRISHTTNALLLDNSDRNSCVYKLYEDPALNKAQSARSQPDHKEMPNKGAKSKIESTQR